MRRDEDKNFFSIFGDKYFFGLQSEITAFHSSEISRAFQDIERLSKTQYCVGYVRYETGKAFLGKTIRSREPLVWFGAYKKCCDLNECQGFSRLPEISVSPSIAYDQFFSSLKCIKDQIKAGNTYQVNYAFDLNVKSSLDPLELFFYLRRFQKTPYGAFLRNAHETILSFSPELFFSIQGNRIVARPMKGTGAKGETDAEHKQNKDFLRKDEKNKAENLMIVDLLRNDIGRIAKPGTIKVPQLFSIEEYSTLYQMTSTVEGELQKGLSLEQIFKALFPCGSVTGAPKIKTMQIIDSVEKGKRGVYCGAIGVIHRGDAVLSVPIRILQRKSNKKTWQYRTGSGIVWDSQPKEEWKEDFLKASFLTSKQLEFSLIETCLCRDGKIQYLEEHVKRMKRSARYFSIPFPDMRVDAQKKNGIVRIVLDRKGHVSYQWLKISNVYHAVKISDKTLNSQNLFLKHKTTFRPWYDEVGARIKNDKLFDMIFYNERGEMCEGARSNIFFEKKGKLFTPPLSSGLLNGILRSELIKEGRCEEKILRLKDVNTADAIYCGNSVRGLVKVSLIGS